MDLIVTVPDDRVSFVKKLLRELNLPVKAAAKASRQPQRSPSSTRPRSSSGLMISARRSTK